MKGQARDRFGSNVDRLRAAGGLSLDALADRSEMRRADVEAILEGKMEADADAIYSLAGALGVSPGDFFDGIEWIPGEGAGGDYRVED